MCSLNSTSAYYKASTITAIKHKVVHIHKNKTNNTQNKNNMVGKNNIKELLGQKS